LAGENPNKLRDRLASLPLYPSQKKVLEITIVPHCASKAKRSSGMYLAKKLKMSVFWLLR
jgi:hypothetical protein